MLIEKVKERFGADILSSEAARGEETIVVRRERFLDVMRTLRDDPAFAFDFLVDVTTVDWLGRKPRFDVVYHLRSIKLGPRLRVKLQMDAGDDAWAPSAAGLWKSADWLERECYDMFGINFKGHPDLRRILLYDEFEGHPLRKDYPVQKRQPLVPETDPIVHPLRPSK